MSGRTCPPRRTRRARLRGFTLVELLVSLVAGLIVAMAVVGLSRDATNTFYEETRAQAAETTLRLALDRVRSDLQRASYMSTANVQADPRIPLDPLLQGTPFPFTAPTVLSSLQGVRVWSAAGGATSKIDPSLIATLSTNAFGRPPDYLEIGGNLTSADEFPVVGTGTGSCAGPRLLLGGNTPSVWRVLQISTDATKQSAAFGRIFQPVAGQAFMVRISGPNGRFAYAMGCAAQTAAVDANHQAYVDLAQDPGFSNQFGFVNGTVTVNPVEVVRWSIRKYNATTDSNYAAFAPSTAVGDDAASKYFLVREWIASDGTPLPGAELVAEYATDLQVAITADLGTYTATPGTPAPTSYAFANAGNDTVAGGNGAVFRPQRVRSVRVMLTTRTASPDRASAISLPGNTYPLRYCLLAAGCTAGQRQWARLRSLTTEVALPNQARLTY